MMNKRILFLLGSASISGGTYVILQHANHLKKMNYDVTIGYVYMTQDEYIHLKNSSQCWHPAIKELTFIHINDLRQQQFDVAIFTWWATIFSCDKINAASTIYFVQSIESRFYNNNETYMHDLIKRTYQLGLPVITEASWIQQFLTSQYNNTCELVRNGILKSIYTCDGPALAQKSDKQLRILVEGPIDIPFKNVPKTIALCQQANVGEIWLLTSTACESYSGVNNVFSQIPIIDVPKIYRSCDVIVKLSYVEGMFGPPLEMFHCGGTAIVYEVTGFDEYIEHNVNALVAKVDDEQSIINYLRLLNKDRQLLTRLKEGAMQTAKQWIDWETSSTGFAQALEKLTALPPAPMHQFLQAFKEQIDVLTVYNSTREQKQYDTLPLYHSSGYFGLNISVHPGNTQIGILFGKKFKRVSIANINLEGVKDPQSTPVHFSLHNQQMLQENNHIFKSESEMGMFIINLNFNPASVQAGQVFNLRIEYRPIENWEFVDYDAKNASNPPYTEII